MIVAARGEFKRSHLDSALFRCGRLPHLAATASRPGRWWACGRRWLSSPSDAPVPMHDCQLAGDWSGEAGCE